MWEIMLRLIFSSLYEDQWQYARSEAENAEQSCQDCANQISGFMPDLRSEK